MRVIIDTNILVSALLVGTTLPKRLVVLWRDRRFELVTSAQQVDELMRVSRYQRIRDRISTSEAGGLINGLRDTATMVTNLPSVDVCVDPFDNYLLAMAVAGSADFLVTGDKRDLVSLRLYKGTKIVTIRDFLTLTGRMR